MDRPDPFPDDPFFKAGNETQWNACIGRQGYELNYLDGYIESAIELATAIVDKKLYGQRDTLVLPILYTARHGVELLLKFVATHLHKAGVLKGDEIKLNHHIRALWERLNEAQLPDQSLVKTLQGPGPLNLNSRRLRICAAVATADRRLGCLYHLTLTHI